MSGRVIASPCFRIVVAVLAAGLFASSARADDGVKETAPVVRELRGPEAFPNELPGERWFAVCRDPEWFRVVALPRSRTHDALGAAGCPKPVFFVRGVPKLVDQSRIALPFEVGRGDERGLVLGRDSYFVRGARPRGSCAAVELATGKRSQLLWAPAAAKADDGASVCPEFCLNRVWAGDLDGDGRPDFLLRTAEAEKRSTLRLYLSSLANAEGLVGEFATAASTPGCR